MATFEFRSLNFYSYFHLQLNWFRPCLPNAPLYFIISNIRDGREWDSNNNSNNNNNNSGQNSTAPGRYSGKLYRNVTVSHFCALIGWYCLKNGYIESKLNVLLFHFARHASLTLLKLFSSKCINYQLIVIIKFLVYIYLWITNLNDWVKLFSSTLFSTMPFAY